MLGEGLEETLGYEVGGRNDGLEFFEVFLVELGGLADDAGIIPETQSKPYVAAGRKYVVFNIWGECSL